jgi:fluoride ion exporter CrcB/FEX
MKKERGFFAKLFCEGNEPSSKRFVGILGALTLFATLFANSFSHLDHAPSESLVNAVALLSFGALGITGAERIFSKNNKKEEKDAVE